MTRSNLVTRLSGSFLLIAAWLAGKRLVAFPSKDIPNELKPAANHLENGMLGSQLTIVTAAARRDWCLLEAYLFHMAPIVKELSRSPIKIVVYDAGLTAAQRWHLDWYLTHGYLDRVVDWEVDLAYVSGWTKRGRLLSSILLAETNCTAGTTFFSPDSSTLFPPKARSSKTPPSYLLWTKPDVLLSADFLNTAATLVSKNQPIWAAKLSARLARQIAVANFWEPLGLSLQEAADHYSLIPNDQVLNQPMRYQFDRATLTYCDAALILFRLPDARSIISTIGDFAQRQASRLTDVTNVHIDSAILSAAVSVLWPESSLATLCVDVGDNISYHGWTSSNRTSCSEIIRRRELTQVRKLAVY